MIVRIKDIHLKATIGAYEPERQTSHEVVLNIEFEYDAAEAARADRLDCAVDYAAVTERIIREVDSSSYHLLEALADSVLQVVMDEPKVTKATVEVDKPGALGGAKSVSVSCSAARGS